MSPISMLYHTPSTRVRALVGLVLSVLPLLIAIWLQHSQGLIPCHLCMFQRVAYVAAAVWFFIAFLHGPKGKTARRTYASLSGLSAACGIALASRHIWLQGLPPDQVPTCGASLSFMMEVLPASEVVLRVLRGTGECAEIDWSFLGGSMAQWSAIALSAILLVSVWLWFAPRQKQIV